MYNIVSGITRNFAVKFARCTAIDVCELLAWSRAKEETGYASDNHDPWHLETGQVQVLRGRRTYAAGRLPKL